ncbi:ABC transporter substrate-binding protein [Sulfurovum sp. bin170]|uniref:Tgt2/MlaC family protein n=1 Tax=Sulfurovum sp. bin170 TaxID=2695268 RepID=UPI0013DF2F38|nr:ABC transporter substrate-binding protein [Sulfurovum sp. bin170]NEW61031.1 ABC transporter substrate-binding protein [Sulfurovum sp. bin170]
MLKKLLVLYPIVAITLAFAIDEGKIKTVMNLKIQKITTLLQDKELEREVQQDRVYMVIDPVFDYKIMSKISLGKKWKTLTDKQKETFIDKYEHKLKASYFEKLELYTDQKVLVKELEKVKSNRIKVYSDIIGKDDTYEVIYKFYKVKDSEDWFIYDIDIAGVSIIQTYRKQFSEFLRTKSIDELIDSL